MLQVECSFLNKGPTTPICTIFLRFSSNILVYLESVLFCMQFGSSYSASNQNFLKEYENKIHIKSRYRQNTQNQYKIETKILRTITIQNAHTETPNKIKLTHRIFTQINNTKSLHIVLIQNI